MPVCSGCVKMYLCRCISAVCAAKQTHSTAYLLIIKINNNIINQYNNVPCLMVSFVGVLWNVQCNQRSPIHKQMTHMIWFFLDESESNQNENKIHMNRETESTSLLKESSLKVRVLCGPDDIRPERRASLLVTETRRWCWLNKTGIKRQRESHWTDPVWTATKQHCHPS